MTYTSSLHLFGMSRMRLEKDKDSDEVDGIGPLQACEAPNGRPYGAEPRSRASIGAARPRSNETLDRRPADGT